MKIVVIGLGSMGKRRIKLIKECFPTYEIVGVDQRQDRREETQKKFLISCVKSIEEVKKMKSVNIAFVCTPPLSHSKIITECLMNKWHVFTELNLINDDYDKNIMLAKKNNCKLFLSSTFLYREETRYINKYVDFSGGWNYIYHIGQYLPDWHPWENYKDFFVGDKKTNGCREIMAIELPWLINTFGKVKNVNIISDKISNLNIEYNDNYMIQIEHDSGNKGILAVDIVSPIAVRRFEAYRQYKYIQWSGTPMSLFQLDSETKDIKRVELRQEEHREGYQAFIIESAYKNEIKDFFDVVQFDKTPIYDFNKDKEILCLIDLVEGKCE